MAKNHFLGPIQHTVLEGGKTKKKLTGAGIGAKFWRIMSRVTTKNLKIGLWGLFEKKRFLYFHLMAQMQIFGSKMQFFGPKSIFFRNHPFFLTPSWLDTKKTTFLCWPWCTEGLGVAVGAHFGPKKAKIRPGSRKTTRRATKRPPTRKPKLSRVTSGHGGHMIPWSRVRLTWKNGGYIGVA